MKKYSLTLLLAAAGCLAVPMTSFAAGTIYDGATSLGGNVAFAPSKSVVLYVNSAATSYAAASGHMQGTEYYAVTSGDTSVFFTTVAEPAGTAAALTTTLTGYVTSSSAVSLTDKK